MKRNCLLIFPSLIFLSCVNLSCSKSEDPANTWKVCFDENWRFIKANPDGAENPSFDDSSIAGVGSGSPNDIASFQQPHRRTWHGKCLPIVLPLTGKEGTITLTATSQNLIS